MFGFARESVMSGKEGRSGTSASGRPVGRAESVGDAETF